MSLDKVRIIGDDILYDGCVIGKLTMPEYNTPRAEFTNMVNGDTDEYADDDIDDDIQDRYDEGFDDGVTETKEKYKVEEEFVALMARIKEATAMVFGESNNLVGVTRELAQANIKMGAVLKVNPELLSK